MKHLNIILQEAGLTLKARVIHYTTGNSVEVVSLTESGTLAGYYSGNISGSLNNGGYPIQFYTETPDGDRILGSGVLYWKDGEEVTPLKHYTEDINPTIM